MERIKKKIDGVRHDGARDPKQDGPVRAEPIGTKLSRDVGSSPPILGKTIYSDGIGRKVRSLDA